MMQGQHEIGLSAIYSKATKEAFSYLSVHHQIEEAQPDDPDAEHVCKQVQGVRRTWHIWRLKIASRQRHYILYVAVPPLFPDELPKFYLSRSEFEELGPIPHVDRNRFICTRDPAVVVLNAKKAGEAIGNLSRIAVDIVEAGRNGELQHEFDHEFLAYWNDAADIGVLLVSFPEHSPSILPMFSLSQATLNANYIIVPSRNQATQLLNRIGSKVEIHKSTEVFFLELSSPPNSIPQDNADIISLLEKLDSNSRHIFSKFSGNTILAAFRREAQSIIVAWRHGMKAVPGFRSKKGSIPLIRSIHTHKSEKIGLFNVIRLDRDRLVARTIGEAHD